MTSKRLCPVNAVIYNGRKEYKDRNFYFCHWVCANLCFSILFANCDGSANAICLISYYVNFPLSLYEHSKYLKLCIIMASVVLLPHIYFLLICILVIHLKKPRLFTCRLCGRTKKQEQSGLLSINVTLHGNYHNL